MKKEAFENLYCKFMDHLGVVPKTVAIQNRVFFLYNYLNENEVRSIFKALKKELKNKSEPDVNDWDKAVISLNLDKDYKLGIRKVYRSKTEIEDIADSAKRFRKVLATGDSYKIDKFIKENKAK
jgi:cytochrome c peroxidase